MAWEWILRNRRSLALNLRHERGRELFLQLAAVADVVIDNFSPRTMPSLGLDHEDPRRCEPRLIVVAMPATGRSARGPSSRHTGPSLAALYGTMSLNGYPEDGRVVHDAAELGPLVAGYGALAVFAALAEQNRSGRGQVIELSQGDPGLAGIAEAVIEHVWNDRDLGPVGNTHRALAPHGIYPCAPARVPRADGNPADQWIAIACGSDAEWQALAGVAGRSDWLERPEYQDLAAVTPRAPRWTARSARGAVAVRNGRLPRSSRTRASPRSQFSTCSRRSTTRTSPSAAATSRCTRTSPDSSCSTATRGTYRRRRRGLRMPAPAVGAHTHEVLREYLGLDAAEIRRLEEGGVLT